MEASPLTQQDRPQIFRPKVDLLYEQLLQDTEEDEKPDGFWTELFLLKPDVARFEQTINKLDARHLLRIQHRSQQFVVNAIAVAKAGQQPADENALQTLALFLNLLLVKRFHSPSTDLIQVLAGLENVDAVFTDLVVAVEQAIAQGQRTELCRYGLRVAIALAAGAFQTSLVTYFAQRDLFTVLTQLLQRLEDPLDTSLALVLLGLLSNYNKFEMHNPYQTRHVEYASRLGITKISQSISSTCYLLRDQYIAVQDDLPEGWSVGNALGYLGLGSIIGSKPKRPALDAQELKQQFASQPQREAAVLLTLYDFVYTNRDFRHEFTSQTPAPETKESSGTTSSMAGFLSLTSYLVQHGHRSTRAGLYAHLSLLITRLILEDPTSSKTLCTTIPHSPIRLCRQRPPFLPVPNPNRPLAAYVLDIAIDCMNHNLRTKLDVRLYTSSLGLITRVLSTLSATRIRLSETQYAWAELWRSLLSLMRFCTSYAESLASLSGIHDLVVEVPRLLARCLSRGETFLAAAAGTDPAAQQTNGKHKTPKTKTPSAAGVDGLDDLCYKIAESGPHLDAFKAAWFGRRTSSSGSNSSTRPLDASCINLLIGASAHFRDQVDSNSSSGSGSSSSASKQRSPDQVMAAIKSSYDTLSLTDTRSYPIHTGSVSADHPAALVGGSSSGAAVNTHDGSMMMTAVESPARFGFKVYHEQDHRALVRRIVRVVVEDAAGMVD